MAGAALGLLSAALQNLDAAPCRVGRAGVGFVPCKEHGTGPALPLHTSASPRQTHKKNAMEIKSNRASGGLPAGCLERPAGNVG